MASRRVPLANNTQAINSPLRPIGPNKRLRDQVNDPRAFQDDKQPPKKKQALESTHHGLQRTRPIPTNVGDARIFDARSNSGHASTFNKKLVATKENCSRAVDKEGNRSKSADKEQVKTWQKHYRKVFPSFVFYFEGLSEDTRRTASRAIAHLGAHDEKFFSKNITHIITTRPIPPDPNKDTSSQPRSSSSRHDQAQASANQAKTINPSLLDKHAADAHSRASQQRSRAVQDLLSHARAPGTVASQDARRAQQTSTDILVKAQEMKMKIWPFEKLEKMLNLLLDPESDDEEPQNQRKRPTVLVKKQQALDEADLQQLLKNEKTMHGGQMLWSDVVPFRGYYVYVHDVEEKNRPVMVREFPRPRENEDGSWPQLHSVAIPRCPFFVEPSSKHDETERQEEAVVQVEKPAGGSKTRAASASHEVAKARAAQPDQRPLHSALEQQSRHMNVPPQPLPPQARMFEPPPLKHTGSNTTTDSLPAHLTNRFHFQGIPRPGSGREPLASGLQQSNQTSAIRSQAISSTAANPVARFGSKSREMHELQRRAVEQRRSNLSVNSVPSSFINDVRAAINNDPTSVPGRGPTRHIHAKPLTKIYEDETQSDEEEQSSSQNHQPQPQQQAQAHRQKQAKQPLAKKKRKEVLREPKPGYCENCRDKYEDFNEHILDKKHRKFATNTDNWTELDALLSKLRRK